MRKLFTLLFVACLYTGTATAQKLEHLKDEDFVMSIIQVEIDGEDYSESYCRAEAFLVFYSRDSVAYFANVWPKAGTQSYGGAILLDLHETDDEMTTVIQWKYANTYDDETGTAQIVLRLINRPVSVAFELFIITEKAEMLMFKGYVNDSLDWKPCFTPRSEMGGVSFSFRN